jgi:hypothetical protein
MAWDFVRLQRWHNFCLEKIVAIHLRQHPEWKAPQEQEWLLRQVVERQTTEVYTLRNDRSDQDLLLHAIEDALYKAQQGTP